MRPLDPEQYETDDDGLPREIVGSWVEDKHERLRRYIGISSAARSKYLGPGKAGAAYIDLFCGPGRSRIRETTTIVGGSPVVAWQESQKRNAPFSRICIADANTQIAETAQHRLLAVSAPASMLIGTARETSKRFVSALDPRGLYFAFLDPFNLRDLPFEVIQNLAKLQRVDLLMHVSAQDLQRNLRRYIESSNCPLDEFCPGWREKIDPSRSDDIVRGKIFEHWRMLLRDLGMKTTEGVELVVGPTNQRLYWLAFAARHDLPMSFWEKIRQVGQQRQSDLGF